MTDAPADDATRSPEIERLLHEPATTCLNCGATLPGTYCPACGQKAQPARQSVGVLMRESFTEFFGLDGRFWRSMGGLLFRPGHLTRVYLEGRRVHYLRPFRLYLTSTLLFFFLLSILDPAARLEREMQGASDADSVIVPAERIAAIDSAMAVPIDRPDSADVSGDGDVSGWEVNLGETLDQAERRRRRRMLVERAILRGMPPDTALSATDLTRAVDALSSPDTTEVRGEPEPWLRGRLAQLSRATNRADQARVTGELIRDAIARVPTVMFVLLPLFAGLLKLLYVRRRWYYAEHLVFGLHTHAFAFFVFSLAVLAVVAGSSVAGILGPIAAVASALIPLYFLVAMRRVYGQSWAKTLVKAGLLAMGYGTLLLFGLLAAAAVAAVA